MSVDKLVDSTQLDSDLTSVANAIRAKGGTSAQLVFPSGFVSAVDAIPTGGDDRPKADENDVILIDFDGRILYSYSAADFANLTELPTISTLKYTFIQQDGWNWTLSAAKSYVAKYKELVIGAQYSTTDGKTHELVDIPYDGMTYKVTVKIANLGSSSGNTITVSWGDGSTDTVETGIGKNVTKTYNHTYSQKGEYEIIIACSNTPYYQVTSEVGSDPQQGYIKAIAASTYNTKTFQPGMYDAIICSGSTNTVGKLMQNNMSNAFIFPRGYAPQAGNSNWFQSNAYLKFVLWGYDATCACWAYLYTDCRCLNRFSIPETTTEIRASCFNGCRSLKKLRIPDTVTSIAQQAFKNCSGLQELHFYPSTPPTVDNADAFASIPTSCRIYVPSGKLTAYTTASNYPDSSTYTYVEE